MKLEIFITKEVLEASKFCQNNMDSNVTMVGQNCAIGRAIHQIFPNSWVGSMTIMVNNRPVEFSMGGLAHGWLDSTTEIELPLFVKNFISKFDSSSPVERVAMSPFSFEIEVPDKVIEMVCIDDIHTLLSNCSTVKQVYGSTNDEALLVSPDLVCQ